MYHSKVLACLAMLASTSWAGYTLQDDYFAGNNFFGQFSFFTGSDPTHGFVQYQSQAAAKSAGLISSTSTNAAMYVDSTNKQPNGRPSVRISSNKSYNNGLIVIDVKHMPYACGAWPAFWMLGPNWPNNGEIDVIEGVNDQTTNDMTCHTGPNCSINNSGFTGHIAQSSCTSSGSNNNGCGISDTRTSSYGAGFNNNGGGAFATEITASAINIWFFPRGAYPSDLLGSTPNPSNWGTPAAKFAGSCSIPNSFKNLQLVFDTTFCGDWAGAVWGQGSCASKASSCTDYVANNPSAFAQAYWSVNSLKVYHNSNAKREDGEPDFEETYFNSTESISRRVPVAWGA